MSPVGWPRQGRTLIRKSTAGRRICGAEHYPVPLLAVAGFGLPGASGSFPTEPLSDAAWTATLAAAQHNRVLGPLRTVIDQGVLPATGEQAQQVRAAHRSAMLRVLSLERELLAAVDLLAGAGVETRVLKGSAVAHLDYAQPGLRSFIDLDILVRPADIDTTVRVLTGAGFVRTLAEPRPGFDRRFDKGTTLRHPAGFEIDLHRTFVLGPWGVLVDIATLWDGGEPFVLSGRELRALSGPNRFLHACYHAALGDWPLRLGSLRDVAEMLPDVEHGAQVVLRRAQGWGVQAVVAAAVADTERLLGISTGGQLAAWARRYAPTRREQAWLALHTHADKTFAAQAVATVSVLPGLRQKAAYLRALLLPDARYTAGRHASAWSRLRYAIREARRGRGAPDDREAPG